MTSKHPIPRLAGQVAEAVREMQVKYKVPQIDIIAHSMGGIIARYYIQNLNGDGAVRNLITLVPPSGNPLVPLPDTAVPLRSQSQ